MHTTAATGIDGETPQWAGEVKRRVHDECDPNTTPLFVVTKYVDFLLVRPHLRAKPEAGSEFGLRHTMRREESLQEVSQGVLPAAFPSIFQGW